MIESEQVSRALTVRDFCARYRASRSHAYSEMRKGALKFFYYGRHRRISLDAAERWFSDQQKIERRAKGSAQNV